MSASPELGEPGAAGHAVLYKRENWTVRTAVALALSAALVTSCSSQPATAPDSSQEFGAIVRIVLVGDVMLGRAIAPLASAAPDELFADIRHLIRQADVAGLNLESPLTSRPHIANNDNVLNADPDAASLLAESGFTVVSLPNNHAGDAGPDGVLDTIAAVEAVGLRTVGGGSDLDDASKPTVIAGPGWSVGLLAFDATGSALVAATEAGVAVWDDRTGPEAIAALAPTVDVLIVSIHGGTEYLPTTDPRMADIGAASIAAGADVLWGHGAHVIQPIAVREGAVLATSLGNFLFDQSGRDRTRGALLEVLADSRGVIAYRVAITEHANRTVEFVDWELPSAAAVWLHGSWWSLVRGPATNMASPAELADFRHGDLVAAASGAVAGDGRHLIVASFRRPFAETEFTRLRPDVQWQDTAGRSAHLGVYEPDGLKEVWVAGSVLSPVAGLAVCDGSIAVSHDTLDDSRVVATGAWEWTGFGFATAPELPGAGTPSCADVDRNGSAEPVVTDRRLP